MKTGANVKKDSPETMLLGVLASIAAVITAAVLSLIPTCMWFCFDDALAKIVGAPWVGEIGFWNFYAAIWFWSMVAPYQTAVRAASRHVESRLSE